MDDIRLTRRGLLQYAVGGALALITCFLIPRRPTSGDAGAGESKKAGAGLAAFEF